MPGPQFAEHCAGVDALTGPNRRRDGFIAGPQPAGMRDRYHRPTREFTGEHHSPRGSGVHPLTRYAREVDTAMTGLPVR